jgi:hypothetical protein
LSWKVTVRNGPQVDRARFETLDEALASARGHVAAALSEGPLGTVSAIRDFTPDKRVRARVEISGKGFMRGPEAGIDVMGDGALVAYVGAIRKQPLDAPTLDAAIESVRGALTRCADRVRPWQAAAPEYWSRSPRWGCSRCRRTRRPRRRERSPSPPR